MGEGLGGWGLLGWVHSVLGLYQVRIRAQSSHCDGQVMGQMTEQENVRSSAKKSCLVSSSKWESRDEF